MKTMNFKRVLISLVTIGCLFTGVANAQKKSAKSEKQPASTEQPAQRQMPTAEERAQKQTDRMKSKLELTTDQESKVKEINLKYAKERDAEMTKAQEVRQQKIEAFKASEDKKDAELKAVLTADQYTKYQQQKSDVKKKMGKQMKGKGKKQCEDQSK